MRRKPEFWLQQSLRLIIDRPLFTSTSPHHLLCVLMPRRPRRAPYKRLEEDDEDESSTLSSPRQRASSLAPSTVDMLERYSSEEPPRKLRRICRTPSNTSASRRHLQDSDGSVPTEMKRTSAREEIVDGWLQLEGTREEDSGSEYEGQANSRNQSAVSEDVGGKGLSCFVRGEEEENGLREELVEEEDETWEVRTTDSEGSGLSNVSNNEDSESGIEEEGSSGGEELEEELDNARHKDADNGVAFSNDEDECIAGE